MRTKPMQISVMAVAALAVFAVAAVLLLSGGNPAQANTAETLTTDNGGGHLRPQETGTSTHGTPEPCPGETGNTNNEAEVVSSGHIALFDVYWNDDEEELTLNPCPPTVVHVPAAGRVPARDDRTESSINIDQTIIHIPNDAMVTLSSTKYPQTKYPAVWTADNLENRSTDSNGNPVGDRKVWVLEACPDGALTDSVCFEYSADLLNPADWGIAGDGVTANGPVRFHIDHVHQLDTGGQGRRYVLAYNDPNDSSSVPNVATINSSNVEHGWLDVSPGEYENPVWFFTRSGRYEFQMHVTGHPEHTRSAGESAISPDASVSSDVREFVVHVGLMADLSVGVTAEAADSADSTLDPGDNVTITIDARNNVGPDTATDTKVNVTLPEGLTHSSAVAASGTAYDSASSVWTIGDLAKDISKTLTITATVADGTRGQEQTVKAHIFAIEEFGTEESLELDPDTKNNNDDASVTVTSIPNTAPIVSTMCSVIEFSKPGTKVCDPVEVKESDTGDTLTYSLVGEDAGHFAVQHVAGGAQIVVAQGASIEYDDEADNFYALTLTVSDGKDEHGNDDSSVDESVDVTINVLDFSVTLVASKTDPSVGEDVTFTITLENSPVPVSELKNYWGTVDPEEGLEGLPGEGNPGTITVRGTREETLVYRIEFYYLVGNEEIGRTESNEITVTWSNSDN